MQLKICKEMNCSSFIKQQISYSRTCESIVEYHNNCYNENVRKRSGKPFDRQRNKDRELDSAGLINSLVSLGVIGITNRKPVESSFLILGRCFFVG